MNLDLSDKRAVVCGSSAGIGRASAVELASLGAQVVLMARSEDKLRLAAAELPAEHGQSHSFAVADFSQPERVGEAIEGIVEDGPVHILVNNTGGPAGGPIADATPDAFRAAFNAHLICNQLLVQAVLGGMKDAGYGRVVNIISTSVKAPIAGLGVSNTIRGAVASWAKTLAGELGAHGITVNNVLPGFTATDRLKSLFGAKAAKLGKDAEQVERDAIATIPAGRLAQAEEVAAAVAFLCTPAAAYINGINLPVDGGRLPTL